jgi:23S rRNA (pseudouridine1915-N3)-methyltransferase
MARIRIFYFSRQRKTPLKEVWEDYFQRLKAWRPVELICIKDGTKDSEYQELKRYLQSQNFLIACDENGQMFTTQAWAEEWKHYDQEGKSVDICIGGADGLHAELLARADAKLALSKMTLPHRFALVLLLEQLYRVESIKRGTSYHRA